MSEIGHLNLYTTKLIYNRMLKTKKHVADKTGYKTWEEVILFLCEYWEKDNLRQTETKLKGESQ